MHMHMHIYRHMCVRIYRHTELEVRRCRVAEQDQGRLRRQRALGGAILIYEDILAQRH